MKYLVLLAVLISCNAAAATPWERYLDEPSPLNASRVRSISYSTPVQGDYDSGDLDILKLQVLGGDPQAFRLAYRLYKLSDGGLAEELGEILASSIRPNPKFFLQQVAVLQVQCSTFGVNVAGSEYVDRDKAQAYELKMRRLALASVKDKSLAKVRQDCLAQLESGHR
jgi:hypothetical protein